MHWDWVLLQKNCTGCGICVDVCSHGALEQSAQCAYPHVSANPCVGCMDCVEQCPFGALEVKRS